MRFPFRIHRRRLVRRVALGLAVLAVAAPSAQALTLDPGALPCAPECSASEVQSVLHDGPGAPQTITIPESLSGRQFGPTDAASTADRATRPVAMRGGGSRYAHATTSNSEVSAGDVGFGIAVGLAAVLAVALVLVSLGRRPGDLAHA